MQSDLVPLLNITHLCRRYLLILYTLGHCGLTTCSSQRNTLDDFWKEFETHIRLNLIYHRNSRLRNIYVPGKKFLLLNLQGLKMVQQTSNVLKTNLIRQATSDGSSTLPITAICSSWRVFTGNLQQRVK